MQCRDTFKIIYYHNRSQHIYSLDQRCRMEEIALISGASEGIGAGIATVLAKQVRFVICLSQFQAVSRE